MYFLSTLFRTLFKLLYIELNKNKSHVTSLTSEIYRLIADLLYYFIDMLSKKIVRSLFSNKISLFLNRNSPQIRY